MIRALRQAQLYGYLVARTGKLYHPGGSRPVWSVQTGLKSSRCSRSLLLLWLRALVQPRPAMAASCCRVSAPAHLATSAWATSARPCTATPRAPIPTSRVRHVRPGHSAAATTAGSFTDRGEEPCNKEMKASVACGCWFSADATSATEACCIGFLDELDARRMISCIIEGEASGADTPAREWAKDRGVAVEPYPADWDNITRPGAVVRRNRAGKLYDALAGHVRNDETRPRTSTVVQVRPEPRNVSGAGAAD